MQTLARARAGVSSNERHVTVEPDGELASFFVVFNANGAVDLDDIHLSSLGHNVSRIAACQRATTDLKSPRSAVIARQRERTSSRNTPSEEISCRVTCLTVDQSEATSMF